MLQGHSILSACIEKGMDSKHVSFPERCTWLELEPYSKERYTPAAVPCCVPFIALPLSAVQVDVTKAWMTFSSCLLAFVFVFGNNIRSIYEARKTFESSIFRQGIVCPYSLLHATLKALSNTAHGTPIFLFLIK